jgi:hypothetical protein
MRKFLKGFLIAATWFVLAITFLGGLYLGTPSTPKPLNIFRVVFEDGNFRDIPADSVGTRGNCNVLITSGKPIVYLCFPHMLLPLGPAKPAEVPTPSATPVAKPGSAPVQSLVEVS